MLACALVAFAAGCGEVDGETAHFPGTVVYDSPDGPYHFHYLSPPWFSAVLPPELTPAGDSPRVFFVPPENVSGVPLEKDAPYTLRVKAVTAPADQALVASAAMLAPPPTADKLRDVMVVARGVVGREMSWKEAPGIFHREAYLSAQNPATSYRMRFTAKLDIENDPLVTQMIASFEPRASTAQGAP
jgi:hypothetical protein